MGNRRLRILEQVTRRAGHRLASSSDTLGRRPFCGIPVLGVVVAANRQGRHQRFPHPVGRARPASVSATRSGSAVINLARGAAGDPAPRATGGRRRDVRRHPVTWAARWGSRPARRPWRDRPAPGGRGGEERRRYPPRLVAAVAGSPTVSSPVRLRGCGRERSTRGLRVEVHGEFERTVLRGSSCR